MASKEGDLLGGEMAERGCLCDSGFELASGPMALWLDRAHRKGSQRFLFVRGRNTPGDLLPIWKTIGHEMDTVWITEKHIFSPSFSGSQKAQWLMQPQPVRFDANENSVTHICIGVFRTEGISFISSFAFSFILFGIFMECQVCIFSLNSLSGRGRTFQSPACIGCLGGDGCWGAAGSLTWKVVRWSGDQGDGLGDSYCGGCCRQQDQAGQRWLFLTT